MSQKESEWKEKIRVAARFRPSTEESAMEYADEAIKAVKKAIAKREIEIAEEVPNALHEYARWILTDGKDAGTLQRRGKKKEITLQLLKH